MYITLPAPQPIFAQALVEFEGYDPWASNHPVIWTLALYRLGPAVRKLSREYAAAEVKQSMPTGHVLGLFCRATNRFRLIPYSLLRHWQGSRVQTDQLPGLLYRAEVERVADPDMVGVGRQFRTGSIITVIIGLVLLSAAGILYLANQLEAPILCAFLGLMFLGFAGVFYGKAWWWKRSQDRFSRQWLKMAQDMAPV